MSWRDRPAAPFTDDRDVPPPRSERDARSASRDFASRPDVVDRPPPRRDDYNDRPPPPRRYDDGPRDYAPRGYGRDSYNDRPPRRDHHEKAPPSEVVGVFGLSVQTRESDLDYEFSRFGTVESVNIVYDQRTERSRGFGFIRMSTIEEAQKCIDNLNGTELQGRRIRVDFSTTTKPHNPTPGAYMGQRRPEYGDRYDGGRYGRDDRGGRYPPNDRYDSRRPPNRDYDHYDGSRYSRDREREPVRGGREDSPRRRDYDDVRSGGGRRSSVSPPPREKDPRADRSFKTYDDAPPAGGDIRY
ncbi:hypothetical protein NCC49_005488 [Naganishia albida]|nr:hypothetical protein NCC49_005488 [Naganishia albida]